MAITRKKNKDNSVLVLDGEMTIYTVAQLKEEFFSAQSELTGSISLDLHAVTEIDTAGVQLLLCAKKMFSTSNRQMSIAKTNELVDAVFTTLDVNSHFLQEH